MKKLNKLWLVSVITLIGFGILSLTGCDNNTSPTESGGSNGETIQNVATPTANPAAGQVASGTTVTLNSTTTGTEIWYTVNGSNPTKGGTNSTLFVSPIQITATVTIKAIAVKEGWNNSAILTASYTVNQGNANFYGQWSSSTSQLTISFGTLRLESIAGDMNGTVYAMTISSWEQTYGYGSANPVYVVSGISTERILVGVSGSSFPEPGGDVSYTLYYWDDDVNPYISLNSNTLNASQRFYKQN